MPKWEEHYHVVSNRFPYVDLVTKRTAYAYGEESQCYRITVSKHNPYRVDRGDWEQIEFDKFPAWVRKRVREVEPLLLLMKPTD